MQVFDCKYMCKRLLAQIFREKFVNLEYEENKEAAPYGGGFLPNLAL